MSFRRWLLLAARSIVAGALAGVAAGGLIFFGFGFVGLEGGDALERTANGWDAAVSFGFRRGLVFGLAISGGLLFVFFMWSVLTDHIEGDRARPWLTLAAAVAVVLGNLQVVRSAGGWDEVAIVTVAFMAIVAAGAVWWVTPWVLRPLE